MHLTEEKTESKIEIESYDYFYSLSNYPRTGGVIIYFKQHRRVKKKLKKILKTINIGLVNTWRNLKKHL